MASGLPFGLWVILVAQDMVPASTECGLVSDVVSDIQAV
jgi:hypothetical protein